MNTAFNIPVDMANQPQVTPFYDQQTNTFSYVVKDSETAACAVIDSVMNLDYPSGTISYGGADEIIAYIKAQQLTLEWILETHMHADHLSAAPYIQHHLGGKIAIGAAITTVQKTFSSIFNTEPSFKTDGSQFDILLADGDCLPIGKLKAYAVHTPGHTPACMSFVMGNATFVGDTLFMPDSGTARVDFPGGDAQTLYRSIQKLLSLPDQMRLFMCHDYAPDEREIEYETSVGEQRAQNIHVKEGVSEQSFIALRNARDATLDMPRLILPSLQVNMRAGHFPPPEDNGKIYLKLPINAFKS